MAMQELDRRLFNIDILILNDQNTQLLREVKTQLILEVSSSTFHPDGLFSTEIFGPVGSRIRNIRQAYIDLKLPIIHPLVYETIMSLNAKYTKIVEGKASAIFNKKIGDFEFSDAPEADTGYTFFINHLDEIKYTENDSTERKFKLKLIKKYGNRASMMSKWLVIPAGLRDYNEDKKGQPTEDEINSLYRKLISTASMVRTNKFSEDDLRLLNPIRLKLQKTVAEIYTYIKTLLDGKHKFIQAKFTARATQYGTRNVITPIPAKIQDLTKPTKITTNHTVVGLYQYIKAIAPITMNRVLGMFINQILNPNNNTAYLVNPETMKTELVTIPAKKRDEWLSMDGLNDIMNKLAQSDLRLEPIKIDKYYLLMLVDDGKNVTIYKDTKDIPENVNPKHVRPLTYAELFYLAVYDVRDKYLGFFTRYPVAGLGGIYPTKIYLKTTTTSRTINYTFGYDNKVVDEYPILGELFVESLSPATNKLARLSGDYDGDSIYNAIYFRKLRKRAKKVSISNIINGKTLSDTNTKGSEMPIADTRIHYTYGLVHLEDFPRGNLIETKGNVEKYEVPEGIEVFTVWNGVRQWIKPESYSIHKDLEMIKVKTHSSRIVYASNDHSFVTLDDNLDYKRSPAIKGMTVPRLRQSVSNIVDKTRLKYTINSNNITINLNKDVGYFFGAFIGDGWVDKTAAHPNAMYMATIHDGLRDKISSILTDYGFANKVYTIGNYHMFEGHKCYSSKSTWYYKPFADLLHKYIGYGACNKHLPEFWVNTPDEFRWGLLSGLIDTDGTLTINRYNEITIQYSTMSKQLAYEIVGLAGSLNISATLSVHFRKDRNEYTIVFNKEAVITMKDKLSLYNTDKREKLGMIGPMLNTTKKFSPMLTDSRLRELRTMINSFKDVTDINRVNEVIKRANKNPEFKYGTFDREHALIIIDKYPEFFEKDLFWKKYADMVKDPTIEWEVITDIEPVPELTTAYDLTIPPAYTFVSETGIVLYDTCSLCLVFTEESNKELSKYLNSKEAYITPSNEIVNSNSDDVSELVMSHLTD